MPKFRELETLKDFQNELPKIKKEWEQLKNKSQFKFTEYTDIQIKELENILLSQQDESVKLPKAFSIICQLDNIHFENKLNLENILSFSPPSERIFCFLEYMELLGDKEYWHYLSDTYIQHDYSSVPFETLKSLFSSTRDYKENLMNSEEQEFFKNLPQEFIIYRAMNKKEANSEKYRFSWTLKKSVALKFVERNKLLFKEDFVIKEHLANKKNVVAYLNARNEEEIIYMQKNGDN